MPQTSWTIASKAQGFAITAAIVAGVVVAIVNPGGPAAAGTSAKAINQLGVAVCFGFGRADFSDYRETAATLPQVVAEAKTLNDSPRWQPVGAALTTMASLGPTTAWTSTQRRAGRRAFAALHSACRPHLT